ALQRDVGREPPLPLHSKENIPDSRAGSLGADFHCTPEEGRAEGKPDLGAAEEQRDKPVDFATVTIADFGISPGSFTKGWKGNSLTLLKFRRRSTIGIRSSPEDKSLIRYLAQQRSSR
ncbi:CDCA2 protein, partial [Campylorhamphus procurvoides]|nr:CDCA2 protein [Campylorhamphus procurvoides]